MKDILHLHVIIFVVVMKDHVVAVFDIE